MSKKIIVDSVNKKKFSGLTSNLWLILMFIIGLYWLISADFSNAAVAQPPNRDEVLLNRHKVGGGKLTQQERFRNVSLTAGNLTGENEATELAFDPVAIAEQSHNVVHPTPGDQVHPQVAYNSDDDEYLVVWHDSRSGTDSDIYGQRVGSDGSLLGENIVINAAAYNQQYPQIAYGNGVYLVAWWHYPDSSVNYIDTYGQIISATGELTGSVLIIANRGGYADREAPSDVVYNSGSEKFLVLWNDLRTAYWNMWGRHVAVTGTMDTPVQITFISTEHENAGIAAYNPDDNQYLITWEHRLTPSSNRDIRGRRMTGDGLVNNSETIYIATGSSQQSGSSIAYLDTAGQYAIVWADNVDSDYDIYGQAVLPDGSLNGGNYIIAAATGDEQLPRLTLDGDIIVWQRQNGGDDGWDLYSRELDDYGLPTTDSFAVLEAMGNQEKVAVATGNGNTNYFLAWQDDREGDWDVCVSIVPSLVANNNFYTTPEDNVLTVISATGVISNDIGTSPLSVTVDIDVSNGRLNLELNGGFVYTPNLDFNGTDTFTYILSDGVLTDTALVTMTVSPINDAPVAVDDLYATLEDTPLTIAPAGVISNDIDVDSMMLTATVGSDVGNGTLVLASDGGFVYTPTLNFNGIDTFTYILSDSALTNTATVTITVTAVNDAPIAIDNLYATLEDTPLTITPTGVISNDIDVDNDTLTATVNSGVNDGALVLNLNGSFVYTPALDFNGIDTFSYILSDGVLTDTAMVTITLTAVNDPPITINDVYTTAENIALNQPAPGVLANDTDAELDELTAVLSNTVSNGSLALTASGSFIYIPATDFCGVDNFTYHADDGTDNSNLATATLNVVCDPTYTIYLPLIMKPAAIATQTTPAINDTPIGSRPVTSIGEIFYTQVVIVGSPLPSNGKFYLSSKTDTLAPAFVDDEVAIMLNNNEIFTYRYGQSGGGVSSALVEVPRSVMEQIAGETIVVEFRDVYSSNVAASEMYLVWIP